MPQFLHPETEQEWLRMRKQDVTSTESAALFGLSPYTTKFELWHKKKSGDDADFHENERTRWGQAMERTIAAMIAETYGVKVRKLSAYVRHDGLCMGSSFDYEIVGVEDAAVEDITLKTLYEQHGPGVLEIKNVDWLVYRDKWVAGENPEAPEHIEIQVQHQLECIDREWTAIAVLVGGNRMVMIPRLRDREIGAALVREIGEFWISQIDNREPPVTLPDDAAFISKLYGTASVGKLFDGNGNVDMLRFCAAYTEANEREKKAKDDKDSAKAELLMLIGDSEKAVTDGFKVSAGVVAPAEIPAYTRPGYRLVRITQVKPKQEKQK